MPHKPRRLEEVVSSFALPEDIRRAWEEDPEILPGQIWRTEWASTVVLVVVLEVGKHIQVAPLTLDAEYADARCLTIGDAVSPLGVPTVIWLALKRSVSRVVFDRFVGTLPGGVFAQLVFETRDNPAALTIGDPRKLFRALVEDDMERMASVQWRGQGTGQLSNILKGTGIAQISETLKVRPQRALALWRGQAALSREEAERMSPVVGEAADALLAANPNPPNELVESLEKPPRHRQMRELAELRAIDRSSAYQEVAYQTWALAARQTGTKKETDWDQRLNTYFAAVIHEQ